MSKLKELLEGIGITNVPEEYFSTDEEVLKDLKPKEKAKEIRTTYEGGLLNKIKADFEKNQKVDFEKKVRDEIFVSTSRKNRKEYAQALGLNLSSSKIDEFKDDKEFKDFLKSEVEKKVGNKDAALLQQQLAESQKKVEELTGTVNGFDDTLKTKASEIRNNLDTKYTLLGRIKERKDLKVNSNMVVESIAEKVMNRVNVKKESGTLEVFNKENPELRVFKGESNTEFLTVDDIIVEIIEQEDLIKKNDFDDEGGAGGQEIEEGNNNFKLPSYKAPVH